MEPTSPAPPPRFTQLRWPSSAFWLQLVACLVVGWSLLHGGISLAPPAPASAPHAATSAPAPHAVASAPRADPALAHTDVVVARNDTLDRIFRRLKLSLADLASVRSLPGVRQALDSLRPGESLRVTHKDGALYGLERRLSETQTLQVSRDAQHGLTANVLENPLQMRTRTIRGVIDRSLFEAVAAAGAHDQTAVALADIFAWDIDFVLDVRAGDA
ncbi:MAG: hypothetical protein JO341_01715, partial [Gammaproteobacteria bacterium]|nr:hypothetical protein [Gammaproteobacteria bacterium]